MINADPDFKMFTLGLGDDLDENFLRNITKLANKE